MSEIRFPHCDARILHAPGECKFCDESGLQAVREVWKINFTGKREEGKALCPAEVARPTDLMYQWPGNRPKPESGFTPEQWKELADALAELGKAARQARPGWLA